MRKLGKKQLTLHLVGPLKAFRPSSPTTISSFAAGDDLIYTYDTQGERPGIARAARRLETAGIRFKDLQTTQSSLEDIFVSLVRESALNIHAIRAIYAFEMARTRRTLMQSIISPVLSTSLYFVVFGAAIGSRITEVEASATARSSSRAHHAVAADAEHRERVVRHLLSQVHRHDLRASVGAHFVSRDRHQLCRRRGDQVDHSRADHPGDRGSVRPVKIDHPVWMVLFLLLTAVTFSLVGFIIGIWADGFEKLQLVPLLIVTPLTILAAASIRSTCCRRSGRRSRCSIRSSI
jgi:ABC-2 type transport system permease protein